MNDQEAIEDLDEILENVVSTEGVFEFSTMSHL